MVALTLASFVAWMRLGNDQIHENWVSGQPGSVAAILKQIFYGFCLGILGLTGFECELLTLNAERFCMRLMLALQVLLIM